mgnify:CR=1 FL=1
MTDLTMFGVIFAQLAFIMLALLFLTARSYLLERRINKLERWQHWCENDPQFDVGTDGVSKWQAPDIDRAPKAWWRT